MLISLAFICHSQVCQYQQHLVILGIRVQILSWLHQHDTKEVRARSSHLCISKMRDVSQRKRRRHLAEIIVKI